MASHLRCREDNPQSPAGVLGREPLALSPMALGFVYLVFAPSLVTRLLAGRAVQVFGTRPALWGGLGVAAAGLPGCRAAAAAAAGAELALRPHWPDADRDRHLLRPGHRNRL